ncbi:MAG TPA: hypothetical protein VHN99_01110 [Deinococcales bacterium]|nr:hypothetical protein [Deinococcales bacterium]
MSETSVTITPAFRTPIVPAELTLRDDGQTVVVSEARPARSFCPESVYLTLSRALYLSNDVPQLGLTGDQQAALDWLDAQRTPEPVRRAEELAAEMRYVNRVLDTRDDLTPAQRSGLRYRFQVAAEALEALEAGERR